MRRIPGLTLLLLLLPLGALHAHQQLLGASPADSAVLHAAPGEIRLTFNQGVEPALASLRLVGPAGDPQQAGHEGAVGRVRHHH